MRIPDVYGAMRISVHRLSVIDVAAIVEAAAVTEAVARNDCVGMVHETRRLAPSTLIEIASRAVIMPRVRNVAAARCASDAARRVAMGHEVGDQRLEPVCKVARHPDRSGRSGHRHHAASA